MCPEQLRLQAHSHALISCTSRPADCKLLCKKGLQCGGVREASTSSFEDRALWPRSPRGAQQQVG
eukprot:931570-Pelagomonas_calceolata.AAC.3